MSPIPDHRTIAAAMVPSSSEISTSFHPLSLHSTEVAILPLPPDRILWTQPWVGSSEHGTAGYEPFGDLERTAWIFKVYHNRDGPSHLASPLSTTPDLLSPSSSPWLFPLLFNISSILPFFTLFHHIYSQLGEFTNTDFAQAGDMSRGRVELPLRNEGGGGGRGGRKRGTRAERGERGSRGGGGRGRIRSDKRTAFGRYVEPDPPSLPQSSSSAGGGYHPDFFKDSSKVRVRVCGGGVLKDFLISLPMSIPLGELTAMIMDQVLQVSSNGRPLPRLLFDGSRVSREGYLADLINEADDYVEVDLVFEQVGGGDTSPLRRSPRKRTGGRSVQHTYWSSEDSDAGLWSSSSDDPTPSSSVKDDRNYHPASVPRKHGTHPSKRARLDSPKVSPSSHAGESSPSFAGDVGRSEEDGWRMDVGGSDLGEGEGSGGGEEGSRVGEGEGGGAWGADCSVTKTKSGGNSSAVLRLALRPLRPSASSDDSFRSHVVAPVLATIHPKLPADIALLGTKKKKSKTVKSGSFDALSKELVSKVIVFAGGRKVTSEEVCEEMETVLLGFQDKLDFEMKGVSTSTATYSSDTNPRIEWRPSRMYQESKYWNFMISPLPPRFGLGAVPNRFDVNVPIPQTEAEPTQEEIDLMTRKLDEFVRSNEAGVKDLVRVKSSLTYEMLQTSIHEIMASVFNFQQRIQLPWMASLSEDNGAIFIVSRLPSFAGLRNLRVREELVDPEYEIDDTSITNLFNGFEPPSTNHLRFLDPSNPSRRVASFALLTTFVRLRELNAVVLDLDRFVLEIQKPFLRSNVNCSTASVHDFRNNLDWRRIITVRNKKTGEAKMVGSFYSTEKESEKEGKEWFDRVKERSEGGGEFEDVVEFALATRGEFPIKRWFYGARDSAFALEVGPMGRVLMMAVNRATKGRSLRVSTLEQRKRIVRFLLEDPLVVRRDGDHRHLLDCCTGEVLFTIDESNPPTTSEKLIELSKLISIDHLVQVVFTLNEEGKPVTSMNAILNIFVTNWLLNRTKHRYPPLIFVLFLLLIDFNAQHPEYLSSDPQHDQQLREVAERIRRLLFLLYLHWIIPCPIEERARMPIGDWISSMKKMEWVAKELRLDMPKPATTADEFLDHPNAKQVNEWIASSDRELKESIQGRTPLWPKALGDFTVVRPSWDQYQNVGDVGRVIMARMEEMGGMLRKSLAGLNIFFEGSSGFIPVFGCDNLEQIYKCFRRFRSRYPECPIINIYLNAIASFARSVLDRAGVNAFDEKTVLYVTDPIWPLVTPLCPHISKHILALSPCRIVHEGELHEDGWGNERNYRKLRWERWSKTRNNYTIGSWGRNSCEGPGSEEDGKREREELERMAKLFRETSGGGWLQSLELGRSDEETVRRVVADLNAKDLYPYYYSAGGEEGEEEEEDLEKEFGILSEEEGDEEGLWEKPE